MTPLSRIPLAVGGMDYAEVSTSGGRRSRERLVDGGDALQQRLEEERASNRYEGNALGGASIALTGTGGGPLAPHAPRHDRVFIPLCFGDEFWDRHDQDVTDLVSLLRRAGSVGTLPR